MGSIFGQALSALQGFFTKGFWFGAFLPVAIFCVLNAVIYYTAFCTGCSLPADFTSDKWFWAAPIAIALIVLAYAVAPLVPFCRGVLDGRLLPERVLESLQADIATRREAARLAAQQADSERESLTLLNAVIEDRLRQAIAEGAASPLPQNLIPARKALKAVEKQEKRSAKGYGLVSNDLWDMVDRVVDALRQNTVADQVALVSRTRCLLPPAIERAATKVKRLNDRLDDWGDELKPTTIGNARNTSELYSQRVYQVGFDYLWPRVQIVIPSAEAVTQRIETTRALLDFSILCLMLTVISLAVWLVLLAAEATNPWAFVLLGLVGPVMIRFFYQLVLEAQKGLGELAQVVVDRYRFDLLKELHIKAPPSLSAEREIWAKLAAVAKGKAPDADFAWTPPA